MIPESTQIPKNLILNDLVQKTRLQDLRIISYLLDMGREIALVSLIVNIFWFGFCKVDFHL